MWKQSLKILEAPIVTTCIQHSFGSPRHSNQRRKRNKRNPNWKNKTVTVCCWHDTIHRKSSKDKREASMRWKEGCNHDKIKSHNHWVGESQTGEQLYHRSPPSGVKVLSPMSGFPTRGSGNGRRNSQRIRLWSLVGFDCKTSIGLGETETPLLEGTHKVVCAPGPRGKEQWPHRRLNQTYLLVLEHLLQRQGATVAHCRDKDTGSRSSGKYFLAWALPESTISPNKEPVSYSTGSPQGKQPTGRELSPSHQQTNRLKFYWALPTRATPSSTHRHSLPSGNLHKPLREFHLPEGREQKQELQSCRLQNKHHNHRKTDKMKRQRTMSQMKEQDKTPEK